MAYKDKTKQREATKERVRRYRAKNKDSALSSPKQGLENAPGLLVTPEPDKGHTVTPDVTPKAILEDWAVGNGTEHQRNMGMLSRHYPIRE